MTADEFWSSTFTAQEKLLFQRVCRALLKKTFIVRDKDEDNRRMYFFAAKYADFFSILTIPFCDPTYCPVISLSSGQNISLLSFFSTFPPSLLLSFFLGNSFRGPPGILKQKETY